MLIIEVDNARLVYNPTNHPTGIRYDVSPESKKVIFFIRQIIRVSEPLWLTKKDCTTGYNCLVALSNGDLFILPLTVSMFLEGIEKIEKIEKREQQPSPTGFSSQAIELLRRNKIEPSGAMWPLQDYQIPTTPVRLNPITDLPMQHRVHLDNQGHAIPWIDPSDRPAPTLSPPPAPPAPPSPLPPPPLKKRIVTWLDNITLKWMRREIVESSDDCESKCDKQPATEK